MAAAGRDPMDRAAASSSIVSCETRRSRNRRWPKPSLAAWRRKLRATAFASRSISKSAPDAGNTSALADSLTIDRSALAPSGIPAMRR